jgi:membrane-associated protease RseP (regulator of RpoE activity)
LGRRSWGESRGLVRRPDPVARERRIAGSLFFATCTSVFVVYLFSWEREPLLSHPDVPMRALVFTATLMGILLAHELGHYSIARMHRFRLTMPWFLPAPFWVGTLGAIIRLEEPPRDRNGLLEMGAAGPLAGLVVIIGVMAFRLWVGPFTDPVGDEWLLARPPLWWALGLALNGTVPPLISTQDPMAFAAWIGCLVTAMNLFPFGQLDGGHVLSACWPAGARIVGWGTTALLVLAGTVWPAWAVWAALLHLMGAREPVEPRDGAKPLSGRSQCVAGMSVVAFFLCFTPVPLWVP